MKTRSFLLAAWVFLSFPGGGAVFAQETPKAQDASSGQEERAGSARPETPVVVSSPKYADFVWRDMAARSTLPPVRNRESHRRLPHRKQKEVIP